MSTELAAAIARSAEGFRADSARARATFQSDSTLQAGFHSEVKLRAHTLTVDEPKGIGGSDRGPTPVELVLAALGTCQEITYRAFATAMGIALVGGVGQGGRGYRFQGIFCDRPHGAPGLQRLAGEYHPAHQSLGERDCTTGGSGEPALSGARHVEHPGTHQPAHDDSYRLRAKRTWAAERPPGNFAERFNRWSGAATAGAQARVTAYIRRRCRGNRRSRWA